MPRTEHGSGTIDDALEASHKRNADNARRALAGVRWRRRQIWQTAMPTMYGCHDYGRRRKATVSMPIDRDATPTMSATPD